MASDTRTRLLDAAAGVLTAHGYKGATIQRIAELAEANIAAVGYHFGGKAALCAAAVERELDRRSAGAPMPRLSDAPEEPAQQLEAFVNWLVKRVLGGGPNSIVMRLSTEMHALDEVLDELVERAIRPMHAALEEIVAALLPPDAEEPRIRRATLSVLGQCMMYRHSAPVIERLYPGLELDEGEVLAISRHVAQFSLAAFAGILELERGA